MRLRRRESREEPGRKGRIAMEEVTRKRLMRKLEQLPEAQLYQALDYIEFLELKYARDSSRKPDAFQQFAERLEDQMRVRSVAPKAMKGTMKVMSTAGKVIDGVRSLGKDLVTPPDRTDVSVRRAGSGNAAGGEAASVSNSAGSSGRSDATVERGEGDGGGEAEVEGTGR